MTRLLALDVGDERIGVAISDDLGLLARPLTVLQRVAGPESFLRLAGIIEREGVSRVVVGLPLLPDGTEGKQVRSTQAYVRGLTSYVDVPIIYWDERYTTQEARALTSMADSRRKRGPVDVDAVAAAVILQDYISEQTEDAD